MVFACSQRSCSGWGQTLSGSRMALPGSEWTCDWPIALDGSKSSGCSRWTYGLRAMVRLGSVRERKERELSECGWTEYGWPELGCDSKECGSTGCGS
jgi:hypothetical protein